MSNQVPVHIEEPTLNTFSEHKKKMLFFVMIFIIIIIIIITVSCSFHYIRYDEMAFVRNIYGVVDTTQVLTNGRYFLTLDKTLIKFPLINQLIKFINLSVFTNNGLSIYIDISLYYRLDSFSLKNIYTLYSTNYDQVIQNSVKSIIRDISGTFSLEDYVRNHTSIQQLIAKKINITLMNNIGISIFENTVVLGAVVTADSIIKSNLQSAVQTQNNFIQQKLQQVLLIIGETSKLVATVNLQTNYIKGLAEIDSQKIEQNSKAESNKIISIARSEGIQQMFILLNITENKIKMDLLKILNLIDNQKNNDSAKIFFGNFNKKIDLFIV
jgi:regulator of protease activity HflC (stomatin/prohibitin superfamily)